MTERGDDENGEVRELKEGLFSLALFNRGEGASDPRRLSLVHDDHSFRDKLMVRHSPTTKSSVDK
jgi:hypothetical protein